jgi:hypothetical protein
MPIRSHVVLVLRWARVVAACQLIEFKGPSVVRGARGSACPAYDQSDNWIRITRQLRTYAVYSGCQQPVLMDERCAFFFFLPNPRDQSEDIRISLLWRLLRTWQPPSN